MSKTVLVCALLLATSLGGACSSSVQRPPAQTYVQIMDASANAFTTEPPITYESDASKHPADGPFILICDRIGDPGFVNFLIDGDGNEAIQCRRHAYRATWIRTDSMWRSDKLEFEVK